MHSMLFLSFVAHQRRDKKKGHHISKATDADCSIWHREPASSAAGTSDLGLLVFQINGCISCIISVFNLTKLCYFDLSLTSSCWIDTKLT